MLVETVVESKEIFTKLIEVIAYINDYDQLLLKLDKSFLRNCVHVISDLLIMINSIRANLTIPCGLRAIPASFSFFFNIYGEKNNF
jgi:hypothetical protein